MRPLHTKIYEIAGEMQDAEINILSRREQKQYLPQNHKITKS